MGEHFRRRQILVDPKFQLQYLKLGVLMALMVAVVLFGVVLILMRAQGIPDDVKQVILKLSIGMVGVLVIYSLIIGLLNVVMTHRVSGAARKLHGFILQLIEGAYGEHVGLRDSDYLQNLAAALNDLSDALQERGRGMDEALAQLEALRERVPGDARQTFSELIARLRQSRRLPEPTEPAAQPKS